MTTAATAFVLFVMTMLAVSFLTPWIMAGAVTMASVFTPAIWV